MLDTFIRPRATPVLEKVAGAVRANRLTATQATFVGLILGIAGMFAVGLESYMAGLGLILGARLMLAVYSVMDRAGEGSTFGRYFNNAARWTIDTGFIFFFAMSAPAHALGAAFILFAYAALQAVSHPDVVNAEKPVYALSGLAEESETILFMALCCFFPHAFAAIAVLFGTLCIITVVGRLWDAGKILR